MSVTFTKSRPSEIDFEDQSDIEVTVVMPCLNEARTVGTCIDKARTAFRELQLRGEVVVADNGSVDDSKAIAHALGARVIEVDRRGYGSALQAGIEAARGLYVIMGDSDDSYDFSQIGPFIEPLRQGYDLVMGNRFRGGIMPGAMPWHHRYIGNPVLTAVLNLFYHTPIGDAHCGLRAFRKDSYRRLNLSTPGMEFASEMVVKASLFNQKITEVPIVLHPDGRDRPPHLRSFRDGWRHLRFLLLLCPTWLYLFPASCLTIVGLTLMAWLTRSPKSIGEIVLGPHTMLLGSLLVVIGYQTLWLWAYSKIYGWLSGLLPTSTFSLPVFNPLYLERGLLAGFLLLAGGFGVNLYLFLQWSRLGFGPLDTISSMPLAIWGCTAMTLGVQTIYGSFFLSMLDLAKNMRGER